jgi:hypothetical protein
MPPTESTSTIGPAEETATPMGNPKTADERERRFVECISTLNKGQLAEVRLIRMNRLANFRKALMELVNQMVEERAEDLAAAMLMEYAPERPKPLPAPRKRLGVRKAVMPPWVREEGKALGGVADRALRTARRG